MIFNLFVEKTKERLCVINVFWFWDQSDSPSASGELGGNPKHIENTQSSPPHTYSLFSSYSKLMEILSGASFPPNTYSSSNSYSNLVEILSGVSFPLNTYCPHNSYSKLMEILPGASNPIHIPCAILMQSWWKSSLEPPSLPIHTPYTIIIENWWKSFWYFLPPQYIFLIQFLFETDGNPLWSFLPSQYIFLIQFLFKVDGMCFGFPPNSPEAEGGSDWSQKQKALKHTQSFLCFFNQKIENHWKHTVFLMFF